MKERVRGESEETRHEEALNSATAAAADAHNTINFFNYNDR